MTVRPPASPWRRVIVAALVGNVWLAASCARSAARDDVPLAERRSVLTTPPGTTLVVGRGASMALSPDGRLVAVVAEAQGTGQIHLRAVDGTASAPLAGTDGAADPFFSPDGQWVGFVAGGTLKKAPVSGGSALTLADGLTLRGIAWGAGETIVLAPRDNTGLWRVSSLGGKLEPLTTLADGDASHRWPQVLPGGRAVLYTIWNGAWEPAQVAVQPLSATGVEATGARRIVLTGGGHARYLAGDTPDRGHLVYAKAEGLMAVPFDVTGLEVTGEPVAVADGLITNFSGGAQFAVSTRTIAFISASGEPAARDLMWVDRKGVTTPAATVRGLGRWYDLSPDGLRIARYNMQGATRDVWVDQLTTGASTRISHRNDPVSAGPIDRLNAVWSADGTRVAYAAGQPLNLYSSAAEGADDRRLTTSDRTQWPSGWSPDGRTLAFVENDSLSGSDIWLLTLDASGTPLGTRPLLRTPFNESAPTISPDGHWLAYQSNESGRYEVYLQAFPEGGKRWQVSSDSGVYPRWSPRGDELFFRSGPARAGLASVRVTRTPAFRPAPAQVLFELRRVESIFEVSPDAARFLMMPAAAQDAAAHLQIVANWRGASAVQRASAQ